MTTATSGVLARFPWILPVRNSFASYGASSVTRTSDRGHVAKARNQGHRSGGVPIRVSKEILLPLNVHWCSVSSSVGKKEEKNKKIHELQLRFSYWFRERVCCLLVLNLVSSTLSFGMPAEAKHVRRTDRYTVTTSYRGRSLMVSPHGLTTTSQKFSWSPKCKKSAYGPKCTKTMGSAGFIRQRRDWKVAEE
jgi:hypothetical protein